MGVRIGFADPEGEAGGAWFGRIVRLLGGRRWAEGLGIILVVPAPPVEVVGGPRTRLPSLHGAGATPVRSDTADQLESWSGHAARHLRGGRVKPFDVGEGDFAAVQHDCADLAPFSSWG